VYEQTCLWYRSLDRIIGNKRTIKFGKLDYTISNWEGDTFPNVIFICLDGMLGYLDIHGKPTDRVVSLELTAISVLMDHNDIRTY
jgi:hypothetical protein